MLGGRFRRCGDADKLDLAELVLADHTARVTPGRAGLGPETGCMRCQPQGQSVSIDDFASDNIGQRHLGGRNQPFVIGTVQILGKFRQLAGAGHRLRVDQIGRSRLDIAKFTGVQVKHETC